MIIIVEGVDRVGKTTFVDKMCQSRKMIRLKDKNECKVSFDSPDFGLFSLGKLDTSVCFLKQMSAQGFDVIVDRLHLTELSYGKIQNRTVSVMDVYSLDNKLSETDAILVYVKPENIAWSSEQAGCDLTEIDKQFAFEYDLSGMEKYTTSFTKLDETVALLNDRLNNVNKNIAKQAVEFVENDGSIVNDTKELLMFTSPFSNITTNEIIKTFNVDIDLSKNFIYDCTYNIDTKYGSYDMKRYFGIFDKLKEAMKMLITDNVYTRRCIIQFDSLHCFQTIQFLIRGNKLVVIANMRSCNVIDNYENDVLVCSLLADEFKRYFSSYIKDYTLSQVHDIIMNIGSLHMFIKGDEEDAGKQ